jgi:hypothetical protein
MDLNKTTTIINEAVKATENLQKAFEVELNQNNETPSAMEMNKSRSILSEKINIIQESNETPNSESNLIQEQSTPSSIKTLSLEENLTVEPNNSTLILSESINIIQEDNETKRAELNLTQEQSPILIEPLPSEVNLTTEQNQSIETINIIELNHTNTSTNIEIDLSSETNSSQTLSCDDNDSNRTEQCQEAEVQGKMIRGLIIFKTRIKPFCDMTGEEFAKQYAQEDWDDIFHEKQFKKELFRACPRIEERYKDKWTPHLYEFTLEYASDSEAIPEC